MLNRDICIYYLNIINYKNIFNNNSNIIYNKSNIKVKNKLKKFIIFLNIFIKEKLFSRYITTHFNSHSFS